MYTKLRFLCLCFLTCFVCSSGYAGDKKQPLVNELQVLIDVSGSMKKNDPKNLRVPAIKLLINLLPEGTKVGLWLFAEKTTVLVKTGVVNKRWKKNALSKVKKIHSSGLFTNIEDAIQNATQEWVKLSNKQNRQLILLTDGVVDTSKDIMQSAESRARIMSEQIPLLQQAGVKVQTIALSAEADAELLDKLALDTQGWSEIALSADQLQKVFFKIFKQAVPQDTVPIMGNRFSMDASIKEFSVLIFKEPGATATQLIAPDKSKINSQSKLKKVSWLSEKNYDLVTIKEPQLGEWQIIATMDPENQVMIVTDLKLNIDELPNHILLNEEIEVTGFFTDQQKLISREDFLNLIELSVQQEGGQKWNMPAINGKSGLFSKAVGAELPHGRHTLKIIADGKTFKREITKTIEVKESLVMVEKQVDLIARTVTIKLIPDQTIINLDKTAVEVSINQIGKNLETQVMKREGKQWLLLVKAPELGETKIVNFSMMANTLKGDIISPNIAPVVIDERIFDKAKPQKKVIVPVKSDKKEFEQDIPENEPDENKDETKDEKQPVNWMKTSVIVIGLNILLIGLGFFGYKFMKKQAASKQAQLLSRLD